MFNETTNNTPPAAPAPDADLNTEIANLRQENTELHELIGAQRAEIERLQNQLKAARQQARQANGYVRLMTALALGA